MQTELKKLIVDTVVQYLQLVKQPVSFVELINPMTQKPFTPNDFWNMLKPSLENMIKEHLNKVDEEEKYVDYTDEGVFPQFTGMPNDANSVLKFQRAVHAYITSLHPSKQLVVLNKIQAETPFLLLDPRRKFKGPINYGFADLLNFICNPIKTGETIKFLKVYPNTNLDQATPNDPVNPFYNPIYYPIPDVAGNANLQSFYDQNRAFFTQKARQLQVIQHQIYNERLTEKDFIRKLDEILQIYVAIFERENNPVELSRMVSWNEMSNASEYSNYANYVSPNEKQAAPWSTGRPMADWRKSHFWDVVHMLTTRAKAAPASLHDFGPVETGVSIGIPSHLQSQKNEKPRRKHKSYGSHSESMH